MIFGDLVNKFGRFFGVRSIFILSAILFVIRFGVRYTEPVWLCRVDDMNFWRRLLWILLLFSIPLYGEASLSAPDGLQHSTHACCLHKGQVCHCHDKMDMHGCLHGQANGQHCDGCHGAAGCQCNHTVSFFVGSSLAFSSLVMSRRFSTPRSVAVSFRYSSEYWRPPRLI